jgi:hypothetical protein
LNERQIVKFFAVQENVDATVQRVAMTKFVVGDPEQERIRLENKKKKKAAASGE